MTGNWFSAKLRRICLVEGHGCTMANDSVHVFQATDFDEAFERALDIGRRHEEEYRTADGQLVRWKLAEVLTLDAVRDSIDGAEVYSEFAEFDPPRGMTIDAIFHPEDSKPNQTF